MFTFYEVRKLIFRLFWLIVLYNMTIICIFSLKTLEFLSYTHYEHLKRFSALSLRLNIINV